MSTIDYYSETITCSECGAENEEVSCVAEQVGCHIYNDIVAGQKCAECGKELDKKDL